MTQIKELSIDLETYSDIDIAKSGVYKYAESDAFEILLLALSVNKGPVRVCDMACGDPIPEDILIAICDPAVTKWAYNAAFERVCLSRWIKTHRPELLPEKYLAPASWKCTMIWAATLGLPLSLDAVSTVLNLEHKKLKEGSELIRYFCRPCRPTEKNAGRARNLPCHDPRKWELFKEYNKRDVEAETDIQNRLKTFPVPEAIWEEYHLDQEINDRGIPIDITLVENAITIDEKARRDLTAALQALTHLENPGSVPQMRRWLQKHGIQTEALDKEAVKKLLTTTDDPKIKEALLLRGQLTKSSVRKYNAMKNTACSDGRARGMFQYYGANRSGRWAGRLIQLQNLPRNYLPDLDQARALAREGDYETLSLLYESVPSVLSELTRTAFIPSRGNKLIVADFAAIEARVLAHIAGETWREKTFAAGGDIYCASAAQMFRVPVEKNGINAHLRQKGKIAELALGYGGSVGALLSMGALEAGMNEEDLRPLVDAWRAANPRITSLWWEVDRAVKTAVTQRTTTQARDIRFQAVSGMLFISLPSGRKLAYAKPRLAENRYGGESVTYEGIGATKKWERIESYGPKFVENIVQAVSRDLLCHAMNLLREYNIIGHVHDEIIIECPPETKLQTICDKMAQAPRWLPGIPLRADGFETSYYKKD